MLRIAQPISEVLIRNAVFVTIELLEFHDRCRRVDTGQLNSKIHSYRYPQQNESPHQQRTVRNVAEHGQQHTEQGIQHQYIAAPKKHQVQKSNQHQNKHTLVEDAETVDTLSCRIGNDDGETNTEQ